MKISIVMGFFLPMPPVAGGSTEKTWHRLAQEFTAHGHEVTVLSRRWPNFPNEEVLHGVRHIRLAGYAHTSQLWRNLLLDFLWSRKLTRAIPAGDIAVLNCVTLPAWLAKRRPDAGRIVILPGRSPKGQFRYYRNLSRILAPSSDVQKKIAKENPSLAPITRITGYPIGWMELQRSPSHASANSMPTIGYVGRIHQEKGLDLLVDALRLLAAGRGATWRAVFCGPQDVARGGSGEAYAKTLAESLSAFLPADRFSFLEPVFDADALARVYQQIDVFCYPSLAAQGETFGVAVAEAMAAGAAPVVSDLPCFTDFVSAGHNGLVFDHRGDGAAARLASALCLAVDDSALRSRLAQAARDSMRRYDFPVFAQSLLKDFSTLAGSHHGS